MLLTRTLGMLAGALACAAVAASPADATTAHTAIVGGYAAPAGAWPSTAYLRGAFHTRRGALEEYACTGSIVAPQWIVTAAHCTFGAGRRPPESMVATLGVTRYTDPAGERIPIDRFVPYPTYDRNDEIGDIGLVHLAHPTSLPAIPLATAEGAVAGQFSSPPNAPNAAGWGALNRRGTKVGTRLQQAYLQIRPSAECSSLISGFDPTTQACAGTPAVASACFGDSGGPLVEIDGLTGQRALWGVTAYGPQVGEGLAPCSPALPAVYTWIPAYANFIESTMSAPTLAGGPPAAPHAIRFTRPGRSAR